MAIKSNLFHPCLSKSAVFFVPTFKPERIQDLSNFYRITGKVVLKNTFPTGLVLFTWDFGVKFDIKKWGFAGRSHENSSTFLNLQGKLYWIEWKMSENQKWQKIVKKGTKSEKNWSIIEKMKLSWNSVHFHIKTVKNDKLR